MFFLNDGYEQDRRILAEDGVTEPQLLALDAEQYPGVDPLAIQDARLKFVPEVPLEFREPKAVHKKRKPAPKPPSWIERRAEYLRGRMGVVGSS